MKPRTSRKGAKPRKIEIINIWQMAKQQTADVNAGKTTRLAIAVGQAQASESITNLVSGWFCAPSVPTNYLIGRRGPD